MNISQLKVFAIIDVWLPQALHAESACTLSVCSSVSLLKTSNNLASFVFAVGKQHPGLSIELICSVLTFQLKERPRLDSCTKKRNSRETKEKKSWKRHTMPKNQEQIQDFSLENWESSLLAFLKMYRWAKRAGHGLHSYFPGGGRGLAQRSRSYTLVIKGRFFAKRLFFQKLRVRIASYKSEFWNDIIIHAIFRLVCALCLMSWFR